MTPKEMAKELVDKYFDLNWDWDGVTKYQWAKEGALIAVNEILNVLFQHHKIDYWQQVKQEIEKL